MQTVCSFILVLAATASTPSVSPKASTPAPEVLAALKSTRGTKASVTNSNAKPDPKGRSVEHRPETVKAH
jgi:hypothetical protein